MTQDSPDTAPNPRYLAFAISTIILGLVGWYASLKLAIEYLTVLKDPGYTPSCDISPLVTCGPNMDSWQGSLFGFSNTLLGIAAFVAPIVVGVALLAGARLRPWFWWIYLLGNTAGFVFVIWLSWQSVFRLGTLCPWCMVVWLVMVPLFWTTLTKTLSSGLPGMTNNSHRLWSELSHWTWVLIVLTYIYIAVIAQIGVDWITHVRLSFM